ncbi:MAG: UDP-2,3-diacylglucosamine diphosphatase LpxI [Desulfobacterales bacterium]|nr:UDP-2,3-diacylglucosamine diphosphatase LpxI [Desulfobacterales bacterium]
MKRIGIIAGGGQFPVLFSQAARAKGFSVYAIGYLKEADPGFEDCVDKIEWVHLGQVKRVVNFFKKNQIHHAVMLGTIKKTRMFSDIRPDMKAISILAGMRHTHDDGILRAFAGVLEKEGVQIQASTFLLPDLLARPGCWTKRKPSRSETADISLGWDIAKEIGRLDVGQCIVTGGGSVLAVEAIEGTDAAIKRGGALGQGSAVVVKVCKPNQDIRFDMPAVGTRTVETMHEAGARALVVEAGKVVVFDRQEMVALADRYDISIVAEERS